MNAPLTTGPAGLAQLTNMKLAMKTLVDAQDAGDGSPRIVVFYGPSGYGKTVAAAYVAAQSNGIYAEAKSVWTQRSLLEALAFEIGIPKIERTAPRIFDQIVRQLNYEPRPLIVDEMDHLVKKQSVEIIRDIHDATRVPIMLIGEESLPTKLREWERFHNRILVATPAQPSTAADARALRDLYCSVAIADDLVELIATRCNGVTRRIVTNLKAVQRAAIDAGTMTVDRAWWGDRRIETGDYSPRRLKGA